MLPPVGTRGRPLRDLRDSPALGVSQLEGWGVEEKARTVCGVEADGRSERRAVLRAGDGMSAVVEGLR